MALLLYTLLFLFIYLIGRVAWKFYSIYRKLHNATKQFRDFGAQQNGSAYGYQSGQEHDYRSSSTNNRTTTQTGDVIEDRRTEDKINRKIFTQEEGEYVDFEEVK
ncbi:DUF4834 family protein [Prevotella sp.]|uniref:DUF4834 family protein n=1 Tax=Prevotella sp. TaxID=59823 RepID=UPI003F7E3E18